MNLQSGFDFMFEIKWSQIFHQGIKIKIFFKEYCLHFGIIEMKVLIIFKFCIYRNVEEYCKDLGNIIKFQDSVKKAKNNIGKLISPKKRSFFKINILYYFFYRLYRRFEHCMQRWSCLSPSNDTWSPQQIIETLFHVRKQIFTGRRW